MAQIATLSSWDPKLWSCYFFHLLQKPRDRLFSVRRVELDQVGSHLLRLSDLDEYFGAKLIGLFIVKSTRNELNRDAVLMNCSKSHYADSSLESPHSQWIVASPFWKYDNVVALSQSLPHLLIHFIVNRLKPVQVAFLKLLYDFSWLFSSDFRLWKNLLNCKYPLGLLQNYSRSDREGSEMGLPSDNQSRLHPDNCASAQSQFHILRAFTRDWGRSPEEKTNSGKPHLFGWANIP